MTTQPQPVVAVTPPLPNRRNVELLLLGFAAVITTVALLIVEANQEQGIRWDLAQYVVAYLALFGAAHVAIRRFAPGAAPLLLPVVALLNGLGLVMIHRLDLTLHKQVLWESDTTTDDEVRATEAKLIRDRRNAAGGRFSFSCLERELSETPTSAPQGCAVLPGRYVSNLGLRNNCLYSSVVAIVRHKAGMTTLSPDLR